jgi:hypothetical protein
MFTGEGHVWLPSTLCHIVPQVWHATVFVADKLVTTLVAKIG